MKLRTAVAQPGVARLGAAGLLSEVGDWMVLIALPVFVLQLTGSPLVTATVFVLELVPTVVVGPLAGVLVDRWDRWRLITGVAAVQGACLLPLLAVHEPNRLWLVYVVVVVESALGTVIEPARAAAAAALVPSDGLLAVNGLFGVLSSLARLVGGPLGGLVLGFWGLPGVVLADAATFAAAALVLAIRRRPRGEPAQVPDADTAPRPEGLLRDWRAGLTLIARSPLLRRAMAVVACMGAAQGAFVVLFVLFVVRDLGGSEADVGVLRGVQAIGGLAGGALLGLFGRMEARRLTALSLGAFGLLSLATWNAPAVTTSLGWYVGLFIAVGVPGLASMTGLITLLQHAVGNADRGRVLSAFFALYGGVQAAGMLVAGLFGTGAGLTVALQVQGALYLLAAVLAVRLRSEQSAADEPLTPVNPGYQR